MQKVTSKINVGLLIDHRYYDAIQYINSTLNNISLMDYCKNVITYLIKAYEKSGEEFWGEINAEYKEKGHASSEGKTFNLDIKIMDIDTDVVFLLDKYIKDFIQYSRNTFDAIAQVINKILLYENPLSPDDVDFIKIKRSLNQRFKQSDILIKVIEILNSNEYVYMNKLNNKIKHISDIKVAVGSSLFGDKTMKGKVAAFKKNTSHFEEKDIKDLITILNEFILDNISDLMSLMNKYIEEHNLNGIRFHTAEFCVQLNDQDKYNDGIIFLQSDDINTMPNRIEMLFVKDQGEKGVISDNFPYNEIFVKNNEGMYVGKFVCENIFDESEDLKSYRGFIKEMFPSKLSHLPQDLIVHKVKRVSIKYMRGDIFPPEEQTVL